MESTVLISGKRHVAPHRTLQMRLKSWSRHGQQQPRLAPYILLLDSSIQSIRSCTTLIAASVILTIVPGSLFVAVALAVMPILPFETVPIDEENVEILPFLFSDNPFLSAVINGQEEMIEQLLVGLLLPTECDIERRLMMPDDDSDHESDSSQSQQSEGPGRGHSGPRGP